MKRILLLLVLTGFTSVVFGQRTLIHCGSLIDGKTKKSAKSGYRSGGRQ